MIILVFYLKSGTDIQISWHILRSNPFKIKQGSQFTKDREEI